MAVAGTPTIHDVARAAGVSISTVSRALSRPDRVNGGTREVVVRAADELGYRPSPQARSLLSGRSDTVMLVLPDVTNPFFFGLIRGVQRQAAESGYSQVVVDTDESVDTETNQLLAARKSVDGVVLAASRLDDTALARAAERVPLVAINRSVAGVGSVVIDTPAAVRDAVAHLARLGHADIAYLGGPTGSWSGNRRRRAVMAAARGLDLRAVHLGNHPPTREGGTAATGAVLASGVTAVLAFNDLQAIGLLAGLATAGVRVPGDVSVVGCDDIFGADFCSPALTTLAAPVEQAGRLATTLLLERLAQPAGTRNPVRSERLPARLVVRGSTGPAPRPARSRGPGTTARPEETSRPETARGAAR